MNQRRTIMFAGGVAYIYGGAGPYGCCRRGRSLPGKAGCRVLVMRLRDPRLVIALAVAACLFAALALVDFVPEVAYEHQVLFTVPWGAEPGALGLAQGADGVLYGPRSFAVHQDRIYVADTFNARVQIFTPRGEVAAVIPLQDMPAAGDDHPLAVFAAAQPEEDAYTLQPGDPWINDLTVDRHGRLYLADGTGPRILLVDGDGAFLDTIDVSGAAPVPAAEAESAPDEPLWLLERLDLDNNGLVYLAHTYLSDQVFARSLVRFEPGQDRFVHLSTAALREGRPLEMTAGSLLPSPANSFALAGDGTLYVEARGADPFARHVRHYGHGNRLLQDWVVRHQRAVMGASLLGTDRFGHAYLLLNGGGEGAAVVQLAGNAPEAVPVISDFHWPPGMAANIYGRVDPQGSVYLAVPGPDGWRLEKWQATWRRRLQWSAGRPAGWAPPAEKTIRQ